MPTKDPHIAVIDAQEQLYLITLQVKAAIARVKAIAVDGRELTADDKLIIKHIQQMAIDATNRVQERLHEELKHG